MVHLFVIFLKIKIFIHLWTDKIIITTKAHDNPKTMKLTKLNEYEINYTGFNKLNIREMKLWDIRKIKDN